MSAPVVWTAAVLVVYRHRCGACEHIVGVDDIDGEVVHLLRTDEGQDREDRHGTAGYGMDLVVGVQRTRVNPRVGGLVSNRVVGRRVNDRDDSVLVDDSDVREFGVLGDDVRRDGLYGGAAGLRDGGNHAVAGLEMTARLR